MPPHILADLVHDLVDEHAHQCDDCPPSARRTILTADSLRQLIGELTQLLDHADGTKP